jgi:co-chaperonin GroES (HSP10)
MQTSDLPDLTTKFNPLHGQVLILPQKQEAERKVGSILLAGYGSTFAVGVVLAAGPGRCLESGPLMPMLVKRGDTVFYHPDTAIDHRIDGQLYHLVNYESLVGYVQG